MSETPETKSINITAEVAEYIENAGSGTGDKTLELKLLHVLLEHKTMLEMLRAKEDAQAILTQLDIIEANRMVRNIGGLKPSKEE